MKKKSLCALLAWSSCLVLLRAGELTFEEKTIDLTAAPDQELVKADFAFESTGDEPAVIRRYDAPCSCLEAQISDGGRLTWQAGEQGKVRALFKTGNFRGTVPKQIAILMDDGERHELTVNLTIPELLKIEPKTLKWAQDGPVEKKCFEISVDEKEPLKILEVTATNPEKFPFELETVEEGKSYKLWVTPADTEVRGFGLLRIKTDSEYKKHQLYQAYTVVTKPRVLEAATEK